MPSFLLEEKNGEKFLKNIYKNVAGYDIIIKKRIKREENYSMNAEIYNYIDANLAKMTGTLSELVAIPSVRGKATLGKPYGEECARVLEKMLSIASSFGFKTENHKNRVGTIDLYPEGEPTLGILCHLDVVPAGNGWKTPPFSMFMSGGKLYGRGTMDDKGPAVCVLYAMKAIKDCGINLSQNVRFIVGTDEENGSSDLAWYKKQAKLPPRVFTPDGSYPVINIEKGMIRGEVTAKCTPSGTKSVLSAEGGTVINAVPESATAEVVGFSDVELALAAKNAGVADLVSFKKEGDKTVIRITGKSAHASTPADGRNAVTALCALLGRLYGDDDSTVMFRNLSSLFPYGETDGKSLKIAASDEKSGALTEVLSILSYSKGTLTGKFDIRFPLCRTVEKVKSGLKSAFSSKDMELSDFSGVEPHETDAESDFVKTLNKVYSDVTGARSGCIAIGGGTYVHDIEGGVAFGAEFPGEDCKIHSAGEFISVDRMKQNAKIFAEAIIRLCK